MISPLNFFLAALSQLRSNFLCRQRISQTTFRRRPIFFFSPLFSASFPLKRSRGKTKLMMMTTRKRKGRKRVTVLLCFCRCDKVSGGGFQMSWNLENSDSPGRGRDSQIVRKNQKYPPFPNISCLNFLIIYFWSRCFPCDTIGRFCDPTWRIERERKMKKWGQKTFLSTTSKERRNTVGT